MSVDILFSVAQASVELNSLVYDNVLWHNLYPTIERRGERSKGEEENNINRDSDLQAIKRTH